MQRYRSAAQLEGNLWRYQFFSALAFTPFFLPVIVLFWQSKGLNLYDIYLLQGLFAIAVVLLEVPTGMVADRMGKRMSLLAATSILGAGFVFYAVSSSFWAFLLAEIILALGVSLLSGADSALLYDSLKAMGREDEYQKFEGKSRSIQLVSFALSNLLGGFLGSYSYELVIWLSALGPFVGFVLVLGFVEPQNQESSGSFRDAFASYQTLLRQSLRFIRKHQLVRWQIALSSVLLGSGTWLLWLYQPYMKWSGLPVWAFGIAFASFNLFAALASRWAHLFDAHLGNKGSIFALMFLQLLPLLLMSVFVAPLSFLFIFGHQAVRGLIRPLLSERILRYTYADKRATVLSLSSMSYRLFFALTAPLVGFVSRRARIDQALLFQAAALLILFAALFWVYRRIPQKYFEVKASVGTQQ